MHIMYMYKEIPTFNQDSKKKSKIKNFKTTAVLTSEQVVPVCGLKEFVCLYLTARQPGGGLREEALYEVLGFIAGDDIIRERETVLEEEEIRVHVYKWILHVQLDLFLIYGRVKLAYIHV